MHTSVKISRAQYDAIPRLLASMNRPSGTTAVGIEQRDAYVRIEFSSGYGNCRFDVLPTGESEQVTFGDSSAISNEYD